MAYREKADPPSYAIVDDSLNPGRRDFFVSNLERNTYYVFTVTGRTQLGWGTPAELEVYTIVNRRKLLYNNIVCNNYGPILSCTKLFYYY